jgi:hypothetical protein
MGTVGDCTSGAGVWGHSQTGHGVVAISDHYRGIEARGNPAGRFEGDVEVMGDIRLLGGDCAEDFETAEAEDVEAGTVVVFDEDGRLKQSREPYDQRVAGVVSGAGGTRPAIILNRQAGVVKSLSLALVGKVFCKVDAANCPITVGDLLTSSPTPGHAMKAVDQDQAFGSVIGKALRPLAEGRALLPILVALQ